jgi:hypothetical protein
MKRRRSTKSHEMTLKERLFRVASCRFVDRLFSSSILLTIALVVSALAVGCVETRTATYQLESQPRAVLAQAGIAPSNDPKLALAASGALHMLAVYGAHGSTQLGLAISHNGGDTFSTPVPVSAVGAEVSSHGENSPSLALTPTEIYALWEQVNERGRTELMFARSVSFGHSFEQPISVTDKAEDSFNGFSSMAVAPDGQVYAVWLDGRDRGAPAGTFSVYLAKSTTRGATFGKNIRVAPGACPCCRVAIAFGNRGEVYIAWRKVFEGDIRDMVVSTSRDGGETFTEPVRVSEDRWKIPGCPHSGAAMASKGGRLYLAWYTEGEEGKAGIRVSWSYDAARTFKPSVFASSNILDANHPSLSVSTDGHALLVFQGRDPAQKEGWNPAQAYLVEINDAGETTPPLAVPNGGNAVSYPIVAAGTAGRVYIGWSEPGQQGGSDILLSRGRKGQ